MDLRGGRNGLKKKMILSSKNGEKVNILLETIKSQGANGKKNGKRNVTIGNNSMKKKLAISETMRLSH